VDNIKTVRFDGAWWFGKRSCFIVPGLNLEMLRPYGVSMIDLLNMKSKPPRKQSAR
jgi:hypothetical protein